jgi:2-amino-4-hydroxy-6-hydroxymethyldihydropteridine diphosphokinase
MTPILHPNSQFSKKIPCYLALGGNNQKTLITLRAAIKKISALEGIFDVKTSGLYLTTPVSSIPQPDFLNAALKLNTTLPPLDLFDRLEEIERDLGKEKKAKEAPRLIDIDLIFYGNEVLENDKLTLPHPRWKERLFVLKPLSELMDLEEVLKHFENKNREVVTKLPLTLVEVS